MTGGPYHIETSSLMCRATQWTGFYMMRASVMKQLMEINKAVNDIYQNTVLKSVMPISDMGF